jgi:thiol-disulfide isomerase/thioredoxin
MGSIVRFRYYFFFIMFITLSCSKVSNSKEILIKGKLVNLPNGKISLLEIDRKLISKSNVKRGNFEFKVRVNDNFEPRLVVLEHFDMNGVKRIFGFKTNRKYRNNPLFINTFFLEDNLIIEGTINEVNFGNELANNKVKVVEISKMIKGGEQTDILNNDTLNFSQINSIKTLSEIIKKAPYSYYYLYDIEKRIPSLSNSQVLLLLNCFDNNLQSSTTVKRIKDYINNRKPNDLNNLNLIDANILSKPLLKKNKINLVILWASWCGPCRKEIPQLKQIHSKYGNNSNFNMVSVSLDEDNESWKKVLEFEKMPWQQLIITSEQRQYQQDIFQFDGSIPTMLFVDKNGKIIDKLRGFDEKDGYINLTNKIEKYLNLNK